MSSTAKRIEEMTDAGKFERLALAVLRRMMPDCHAVIHEGANADGKPIASKIDAFAIVPGSHPARCVLVACTTEKRKGIKAKWLFDHQNPEGYQGDFKQGPKRRKTPEAKDDGDLPKAIRDAAEKRKELPNAKFKVYLVTNLHGVGELQTAVKAAGDNAGIETEIVDGSRLADFLDMNPKGEYVGAHFFGTPVKHVSLDLLKQIGGSSLEQRQARPDFKTATKRVPRAIADVLRDALTNPATGLIWLVASPGKGKSVLAVEAAIAHLNASGFALWLSEEDVNGAETLRQAVDSALRRECPTLEQDAGRQALRLFTSDQRLVLLLDDLNLLSNPAVAFWKVQAWVRSAAATDRDGNGQRNAEMPWTIVCPIWPQYFPKMDRSPGVSNQPSSWEEIVEVPDLSHAEAAMVFSDTGLSVAEMEQAADELGSDPLLCCLAAEEIRRSRTVMPHAVHGVLRRYID